MLYTPSYFIVLLIGRMQYAPTLISGFPSSYPISTNNWLLVTISPVLQYIFFTFPFI